LRIAGNFPALMLKRNARKSLAHQGAARVAIVAASYNRRYVEGMLRAVKNDLAAAKVEQIQTVRVPGSFEIPAVVRVLAGQRRDRPEAIICLGLIWQGETLHAEHIGAAITQALMSLAVRYRIPIIHQVLLVNDSAQARARCLDSK